MFTIYNAYACESTFCLRNSLSLKIVVKTIVISVGLG
jgi:hypothetical protein